MVRVIFKVVFVGLGGMAIVLLIGPSSIGNLFTHNDDKDSRERETWVTPVLSELPVSAETSEIKYGHELIAHTSVYLGPKGSVRAISNGMNCQNCHLNAGTKPFGNNYSAVASTFPKFRPRSGAVESIEKRINDCLERSLNGKSLANDSREMRAMVAYIRWLGKGVQKNVVPPGAGIVQLPFANRAADPVKGKILYNATCRVCHGKSGEGLSSTTGNEWIYPPLWGDKSYNVGAGLYRLSRFAGYIKVNMPFTATGDQPRLTDEEAWDIAAYVNTQPRPSKDLSQDWPDISTKPFDHPFGPFSDSFPELQHKLGPFQPIADQHKAIADSGKRN